jgi:c-di-AMP phosphodiesterase-like protein
MMAAKLENLISSYIPMPMCVIDKNGKVINANDKIGQVFLYDGIVGGDIFALTGIKVCELYDEAKNNNQPLLKRNDKIFKLICHQVNSSENSELAILFEDVTTFEELKEKYNKEKICIAKIQIDNYDELLANVQIDAKISILNEIDKTIRAWGEKIDSSINMIKDDSYVVAFENMYLDKLIASKFELLDEVRNIDTGIDFPVSLSMGVGVGGSTPLKNEEYADAALDLALGRGGDQAVIKSKDKMKYFGGVLQTVEKRNKGKSRIVSHALRQLVDQSNKIFIMGHSNPDIDCFGSSLGIVRFCILCNKEPYIVIDNYNDALQTLVKQAKKNENYKFISCERAKAMAEKDSLVVVLDTHRPSMVQCPELLDICEKIVVIDHHRRVEDVIENPVLAYMETYASSTSELVTEILQYRTSKKSLIKLEAEALLAGITIDTGGFKVKTGVRTFEAAAWLRRQGADPTEVSRFFQEDRERFMIRTEALANAKYYENGVATAICSAGHEDEQVICAQVANSLLTLKGIRASFVAGINSKGRTVISARSLGDVNVQVIMEKFNGGGHFTTAAAQVDMTPEEVMDKINEIMEV